MTVYIWEAVWSSQSEEAVWGQNHPFDLSIPRGKSSPVAGFSASLIFSIPPNSWSQVLLRTITTHVTHTVLIFQIFLGYVFSSQFSGKLRTNEYREDEIKFLLMVVKLVSDYENHRYDLRAIRQWAMIASDHSKVSGSASTFGSQNSPM